VNSQQRRALILKATRAAKELHRAYNYDRDGLIRIDVYRTIHRQGAVLIFRPMDKLLGAFFREDAAGIMINTERPVGQQRYTAAHELGHMVMGHNPSADDKNILRRSPINLATDVPRQELEADVFASAFLLPTFVIVNHFRKQDLHPGDILTPHDIYQASLRHGSSYKATLFAYEREKLIEPAQRREMLKVQPKSLKLDLVAGAYDGNWRHRDVWRLTEADRDTVIEANPGDLFVLKLKENPSTGFIWTYEELADSGFAILQDINEVADPHILGAPARRWVVGDTSELNPGTYRLLEQRLFGSKNISQELAIDYQPVLGRVTGLYTHQIAA